MDFETVVQSGLEIQDRTAYKSVRSDRSAVPQSGPASLVMKRGGIICFFYVDDIVFVYRKKNSEAVTEVVNEMQNHFRLNPIGELKWFLGMHIFRDRLKRSL